MDSNFDYGQALTYLKQGLMLQRKGWNGKGMFVFMRPFDTLPKAVVENVKSLPVEVKNFLSKQERPIDFKAYLCMYNAKGEVVNGWLASQEDMLANDWQLFQEGEPLDNEGEDSPNDEANPNAGS